MKAKKLWILVEVYRGIPNSITVFKKRHAALAGEKQLRKRMNPEYDEAGLFPIDLAELVSRDRVSVENGMI